MEKIILKKGGKLITEKDKNVKVVIPFLDVNFELEDGVTLRDYFKCVDKYKDLQMIDLFYKEFLEEYRTCKKMVQTDNELTAITIRKCVSSEKVGKKYDFDFSSYNDVGGIGKPDPEFGNSSYAIEFTPLNELIDLPIKILPTKLCIEDWSIKDIKNRIIWEKEFKDSTISVYDFFKGIIWELSFMGTPKQRNIQVDKLNKISDDIKSGKAKLVPMDEVFNKKFKDLVEDDE